MGAAGGLGLAALVEAVERVLAHGLEHAEAAGAARQQAVLDERGDAVERLEPADGLGGLQRAAAGEDAEALEGRARGRVEQVVAPADRRPQRLLAERARRAGRSSGGPAGGRAGRGSPPA